MSTTTTTSYVPTIADLQEMEEVNLQDIQERGRKLQEMLQEVNIFIGQVFLDRTSSPETGIRWWPVAHVYDVPGDSVNRSRIIGPRVRVTALQDRYLQIRESLCNTTMRDGRLCERTAPCRYHS